MRISRSMSDQHELEERKKTCVSGQCLASTTQFPNIQSRRHQTLRQRLYLSAASPRLLHLSRRSLYFEASFVGERTSTRFDGKERLARLAIPRLALWTGGPFTQLERKSERKLPARPGCCCH